MKIVHSAKFHVSCWRFFRSSPPSYFVHLSLYQFLTQSLSLSQYRYHHQSETGNMRRNQLYLMKMLISWKLWRHSILESDFEFPELEPPRPQGVEGLESRYS